MFNFNQRFSALTFRLISRNNLIRTKRCQVAAYSSDVSRYPVPADDEVHPSIKQRISETSEKAGFVPNVMRVYARRPDEFNAFFNYYDVLMESNRGSLTKAEKELIVVATSAANGCLYCVIAHSALHRIYSKNPRLADQVSTNVAAADLSDRERAIVDFALKVSRMEELLETDFSSMLQHGLDSEDAWDIGAIASFFAMSNRMAHLTAMRPNDEFYIMGRIPREKSKLSSGMELRDKMGRIVDPI